VQGAVHYSTVGLAKREFICSLLRESRFGLQYFHWTQRASFVNKRDVKKLQCGHQLGEHPEFFQWGKPADSSAIYISKGKGKIQPRIGHEGPEGE